MDDKFDRFPNKIFMSICSSLITFENDCLNDTRQDLICWGNFSSTKFLNQIK
jgi:hypothetical protein